MADLKTYQFDKMQNYPETDARIYHQLAKQRNFIFMGETPSQRMGVLISGLTMTVGAGEIMIQGRLIELTTDFSITVEPLSSGYLVIEINTFLENTSTGTPGQADYTPVNNQVSIKTVENIQKNNINLSGQGGVYDYVLGSYVASSNAITYSPNFEEVKPKQDVLFEGAVLGGNVKISSGYNIYDYTFLNIYINSAPDGTPFGNGLLVVLADAPSVQTVVFADTTAENNHSTYMGKFAISPYIDDFGNINGHLVISQSISNVTHISGKNHGGGSTYYVRKIIGIR